MQFLEISTQLEHAQKTHQAALQAAATTLRTALLADPVVARHTEWVRVQARTKAAYSAYTKMQRKGAALDELEDVLGLRVIFRPAVTRKLPVPLHWQRQCMLCFRVLEVAHALYPAASAKLKDYITQPKPNGYQSLHSTLHLEGSTIAEIQIRTSEMHRYAEHGKAAHWLFKCDDGRPAEDWCARSRHTARSPLPAPPPLPSPKQKNCTLRLPSSRVAPRFASTSTLAPPILLLPPATPVSHATAPEGKVAPRNAALAACEGFAPSSRRPPPQLLDLDLDVC